MDEARVEYWDQHQSQIPTARVLSGSASNLVEPKIESCCWRRFQARVVSFEVSAKLEIILSYWGTGAEPGTRLLGDRRFFLYLVEPLRPVVRLVCPPTNFVFRPSQPGSMLVVGVWVGKGGEQQVFQEHRLFFGALFLTGSPSLCLASPAG